MLVAELRYVGSWFAIFGVFIVSAVIALAIGRYAHLSASLSAGLFFVLLCVSAYGWAALYLQKLRRSNATTVPAKSEGGASTPSSQARCSPILITVAVLLLDAYSIATQIPQLSATGWKRGAGFDCFGLLCISTTAFVVYTVAEWQRKWTYRRLPEVPLEAFTQRRLVAFAAAADLPTIAERRQAIRPLLIRGYGRIGIVVLELVLMVGLIPTIGPILALFCSFAVSGGIFLVLHRLIDL